MKEALLKLFNNDILYQVLSLILTPVLGYLLVMYSKAKKKLIASLEEKTKESPNKYDDLIVKIISDFVQESAGIESGNVAIKDAVKNISSKIVEKAETEIKEKLSNKLTENVEDKILIAADKILSNVENKIHAADVIGNSLYTDNFKVTEIINSEKDLLKKDVNGYITAYAEAQGFVSDTEKFAQGIVGIAATKTF
jgi:ribosomal protein S17E